MSSIVVFADSSGAVLAVRAPAPGVDPATLTSDGPSGSTGTVVDATALPKLPVFQSAWRVSGSAVTVDLPTARTLWATALVARAATVATAVRRAWMDASITVNTSVQAALATRLTALLAVASTDLSAATDESTLAAIVPSCITDPLPA